MKTRRAHACSMAKAYRAAQPAATPAATRMQTPRRQRNVTASPVHGLAPVQKARLAAKSRTACRRFAQRERDVFSRGQVTAQPTSRRGAGRTQAEDSSSCGAAGTAPQRT